MASSFCASSSWGSGGAACVHHPFFIPFRLTRPLPVSLHSLPPYFHSSLLPVLSSTFSSSCHVSFKLLSNYLMTAYLSSFRVCTLPYAPLAYVFLPYTLCAFLCTNLVLYVLIFDDYVNSRFQQSPFFLPVKASHPPYPPV